MIKKQLENIHTAIGNGYRVWISAKVTTKILYSNPKTHFCKRKWVNTPMIKIINPLGKQLTPGKTGIYQLMIKRKVYRIDAYQCLHFSLWIDQIDPDTKDPIEQAYLGYRDKAKVYYRDDSLCKKQTQQNFDMDCPF
jgi:hypothetical protein